MVAINEQTLVGEGKVFFWGAPAITIAVVGGDEAVRRKRVSYLDRAEGTRVVGAYESGEELLRALPRILPDLVLMDVRLPGMSGIECTREIKCSLPQVEVLIVTAVKGWDSIFKALQAGVVGYLLEPVSPSALRAAVEDFRSGGAPMSPAVSRRVVKYLQKRESPAGQAARKQRKLSPRENGILDRYANGQPDADVAKGLGITPATLRAYTIQIYRKLDVHSRADAIAKYLGACRVAGGAAELVH
jgi:DNA-binding NarL/FixJ family response regulator